MANCQIQGPSQCTLHKEVHSAGWQHSERGQLLGGRWCCQHLPLISIPSLLQKERRWQIRLVNLPDAVTSSFVIGTLFYWLVDIT